MAAPLRGISQRVTAPPYPLPTYILGNRATNVADPLASRNVLQDLDVSPEPDYNHLYHRYGQPGKYGNKKGRMTEPLQSPSLTGLRLKRCRCL